MSKTPWPKIARLLARELSHHGFCPVHPCQRTHRKDDSCPVCIWKWAMGEIAKAEAGKGANDA